MLQGKLVFVFLPIYGVVGFERDISWACAPFGEKEAKEEDEAGEGYGAEPKCFTLSC